MSLATIAKVRRLKKLQADMRAARLRNAHRPPDYTKLSLQEFIPAVTPRWSSPRHLEPITDIIERAASGEEVDACISVPPQHGKTETILHGIAWYLLRHPEKTIAYASYAEKFAHSKSRLARDYAIAAGVELRGDSKAVNEWRTPQGGGLLATGAGGSLTGHGVQLMIIDDPLKNRVEAESPTIRQRVYDWFTSTTQTRLHPNSSTLVVHTRWHADDLIGRLRRHKEVDWEVVNLQAIRDGKALWEEGRPLKFLEKRRKVVGGYDWASLYQGNRSPPPLQKSQPACNGRS